VENQNIYAFSLSFIMISPATNNNITHSTCEIAFEWKDGRRLANNQDVAYILPSDNIEVDRLKLNHELWR
jgi:hypothetical protein